MQLLIKDNTAAVQQISMTCSNDLLWWLKSDVRFFVPYKYSYLLTYLLIYLICNRKVTSKIAILMRIRTNVAPFAMFWGEQQEFDTKPGTEHTCIKNTTLDGESTMPSCHNKTHHNLPHTYLSNECLVYLVANCGSLLPSLFVSQYILPQQAKTFHILPDIIPQSLSWTSLLSSSIYFNRHMVT